MMQETLAVLYPKTVWLDYQLTPNLITYLQCQRWIAEHETVISVEKPGEGNMNFVMRVITDQKTFIVKQARPWVQKYPQVAAPIERVGVEAAFYKCISEVTTLQSFVPKLIGYDEDNFTLALDDMGSGGDFTYIYQKDQQLTSDELTTLTDFLTILHAIEPTDFPGNLAMKTLNYEHIFRFPFEETTGFDLNMVQHSLADIALSYKRNKALKNSIEELGNLYLQTGKTLLHGDYYPGSWLNATSGVKVLDPEFGFMGRAEFDLGVFLAHLKIAQNDTLIPQVMTRYQKPADFNESLMWGFAGTEILRRILGLAQLPLLMSLLEKEALLQVATSYII